MLLKQKTPRALWGIGCITLLLLNPVIVAINVYNPGNVYGFDFQRFTLVEFIVLNAPHVIAVGVVVVRNVAEPSELGRVIRRSFVWPTLVFLSSIAVIALHVASGEDPFASLLIAAVLLVATLPATIPAMLVYGAFSALATRYMLFEGTQTDAH